MTTKSKGDSVRQKLANLSAKLSIPFPSLETVFVIERLVARLVANKELSKRLVFKGGYVGLKVYESSRYTVDLDALLIKSDIESTLKLTKEMAEADLEDGVWFRFESQIDLATQGEYGGIRQIYRAGIGEVLKNIKKAQIINFDLGIGDPVTPGPKKVETTSLLQENSEISWSVYPIETIIAEKLHALISHGDQNSRSKDVHDLAVFLPKADFKVLKEAINKCFDFRGMDVPRNFIAAVKRIDTTNLNRGWPSAIASVPGAPSFKSAFENVLKQLANFEPD